MQILLIDDEAGVRRSLSGALRSKGHRVVTASDGNEGMRRLRAGAYDLVIADVRLPGPDGFSILRYARRSGRAPDVVLMTAYGAIDDAVEAMKARATDYLAKPFAADKLLSRIKRIEERQSLVRSLNLPSTTGVAETRELGLVGRSAAMERVRAQIEAIGPSDASVLITGESGTGKELVARALHGHDPARDRPFVAINCASFPETLLEAELFGYERGAFTGATRAREGRFAATGGGTLFLDEISEMHPSSQAKLLRVLQERTFSPLGTNRVVALDARILSATNKSLTSLVKEHRFREDLFFRIKVLDIELPPLREREGDLALLCAHFLQRLAHGEAPWPISAEAWGLLSGYSFPGNVRELEHAMERAVVLAGANSAKEIRPEHLPPEIQALKTRDRSAPHKAVSPLGAAQREFEREYLLRALCVCGGNKTRAAKLLGISRKNLWEKLRGHSVTDAEIAEELVAHEQSR